MTILTCVIIPIASKSEYRVFRLQITKANEDPKSTEPPEIRTIESTLDPLQYPYYFPVAANERVTYTETWRCRGRTSDFTPLCSQPAKGSQLRKSSNLKKEESTAASSKIPPQK